ncbi:MAG: hypothetical protein FJ225_02345 [Lentisphaerae bacterium]|nr:hypothetical protein [Lentisphaerota bacterium]
MPINRFPFRAFANPGKEFRGKPFWSWNGKLEPDELRWQVRVMKRMGLGGFFMHSRVGLDTAYLGKDWFACVDACVDEAKQQDMEAWLYDEDRWPSGAAGGLVTKDRRHRQRALAVDLLEKPGDLRWTADTVAAFAAAIEGTNARGVRPLARGKKPRLAPGECIVRFRLWVAPDSPGFNGQAYLDTLSHSAVRAFIRRTHEAYRKHCGDEFGKAIPGIFSDEPSYGGILDGRWGTEKNLLPWTGALPRVFRARHGYDLLPRLMELAFDVEGANAARTRWHYGDCLTHLYVDSFCRQIGEWCAKHKLLFTGHQLEEATPSSQTNMVGSCLRTYEYMQAPGMDSLTERRNEFATAKQVSSAARQFGWKWRLTETYGCTGWDFPFAGHKAVGDWQVALGINQRCQHLSWYTMLGEAKRDFPASLLHQSPWWELYPAVEDYFARVHAAMTRGGEVRDLLVIHPVESIWTTIRTGWRWAPAAQTLDRNFARLTDHLLARHLDFDYGDEELLSRHGKVAREAGAPVLRLAKGVYRAVLVPPLLTLRRSTLKLLKKFKAAGGTVVFAGEPSPAVDAEPSGDVAAFAAGCPRTDAECSVAGPELERTCRRVSILDGAGAEITPALYLLREDKDFCYLFVCNTGFDFLAAKEGRTFDFMAIPPMARDRNLTFPEVTIRGFAGCAGRPVELDPASGRVLAADAERRDGGWHIRTSLGVLGSRIFVAPKKAGLKLPAEARPVLREVRSEPLRSESWTISLSEANNLVLDRPALRIGDGAWRDVGDILRADGTVRDLLGLPRRGGEMVQPWAREHSPFSKSAHVTLRYTFEVQEAVSGDLHLALERPDLFRIAVNGHGISSDTDGGWWVDKSLRRLPLDPSLLRPGANELILECDYNENHPGLEIVYLLGTFGVAVAGTAVSVTAPPASLTIGDWCGQGLAFYSGSVGYGMRVRPQRAAGERLIVRVPEYRGVALRVLVDGKVAGTVGWEPNEVDITDLLSGGEAHLVIQVVGSRRNSHGPFHINEKWPIWTGPGEFTREGDTWLDGYQLVPCGLLKDPELVVKTE